MAGFDQVFTQMGLMVTDSGSIRVPAFVIPEYHGTDLLNEKGSFSHEDFFERGWAIEEGVKHSDYDMPVKNMVDRMSSIASSGKLEYR
eukprot:UN04272